MIMYYIMILIVCISMFVKYMLSMLSNTHAFILNGIIGHGQIIILLNMFGLRFNLYMC